MTFDRSFVLMLLYVVFKSRTSGQIVTAGNGISPIDTRFSKSLITIWSVTNLSVVWRMSKMNMIEDKDSIKIQNSLELLLVRRWKHSDRFITFRSSLAIDHWCNLSHGLLKHQRNSSHFLKRPFRSFVETATDWFEIDFVWWRKSVIIVLFWTDITVISLTISKLVVGRRYDMW